MSSSIRNRIDENETPTEHSPRFQKPRWYTNTCYPRIRYSKHNTTIATTVAQSNLYQPYHFLSPLNHYDQLFKHPTFLIILPLLKQNHHLAPRVFYDAIHLDIVLIVSEWIF